MASDWVEWCLTCPEASAPTRGTIGAGGWDLYACEDHPLEPMTATLASTGVAAAIPHGWVGLIKPRSSLASIGITTDAGVIDSDYRGEIQVLMRNLTKEYWSIKKGDRIAQMVIVPYLTNAIVVKQLSATQRAANGFGSTGR